MKKLNKFFAVLVALAMMAMLSVTAFAAEGDPPAAQGTIAVTKNLQVSNDISITDVTGGVDIQFVFDSANGSAATTIPQPTGEDEVFTAKKHIDFQTSTKVDGTPGDTSTVYSYTTDTIAPADLGLDQNSKPGVYTYTVTEKNYAYAVTGNENELKTTGSETTKTFTLKVLKTNDGKYQFVVEGEDGKKKEIKNGTTPGDITGNQFQFTNNLYDERSSDPGNYTNAAFGVSKAVTDTAKIYADEAFPFTVSVKLPAGAVAGDVVAYFSRATGTGETKTYTDVLAVQGTDYKIDGSEFTINLKDGEKFYFTKLPAGSLVSASEKVTDLVGETADAKKMYFMATKDPVTAATIPSTGSEKADYINESQLDNTFEGVLHNSIPYIVLALVAIGGMVAYVVVRRRNADEA